MFDFVGALDADLAGVEAVGGVVERFGEFVAGVEDGGGVGEVDWGGEFDVGSDEVASGYLFVNAGVAYGFGGDVGDDVGHFTEEV